ncbi:MAG: hypothetical protein AUJ57_08125 [Zetaproteobacteria bacterium CG1_02_53_45]|nr:MAG: hypothetical protein AUJ57_08125 [Zetaproteobacteria bacterium CG1_02_53_45]
MDKILAGPILRRVDPKQVNIWLASSCPLLLRGELFLQHDLSTNIGPKSSFRTVKLGDRLYVHLVRIRPPANVSYPQDKLLCYDLLSRDPGGNEKSLLRDNPDVLFAGANSLELPGFFMPARLKKVLHGSCRKPHAKQALPGWQKVDQLSCGARLIEKHQLDLDERPAALFLTGDQIYADDVAMPVLAMLLDQAKALTGWDESIPVDAHGNVVTPAAIRLAGRSHDLHLNQYGFTSGEADNHLLTFGEFAAMYLAAWGGAVSMPTDRKQMARMHASSHGAAAYRGQRERAIAFFATRRDVRRLFANIPVYMIFDDHEVTDDWNLNPAWEARMYGHPFGRRVVSNALAAYWAFQAWGNDPDKYDDAFIDAIGKHVMSKQVGGDGANAFETQMLDRSVVDRWSYTLPTHPYTVVLDTRMQREVGSAGVKGASILMNRQARSWLQQMLEQEKQGRGEDFPLLLVSASPVFGFSRMEKLQDLADRLGLDASAIDKESWKEGFAQLEAVITQPSCGIAAVTVLSGDVHYSFAVSDYFQSADKSRRIGVGQLTSSPISNRPAGGFIGKNLLKVKAGEYPELVRPEESRHSTVTSLNQIALASFDQTGATDRHVLVARKSRGGEAEYTLTYRFE